jgi:hypothetical protein
MNIRKFIWEELRKHLMENDNQNLFPLTLYSVTFHTSDSSDNEYFGTDADMAKLEFESNPDIPERMLNRTDMGIELQSQTNQYRFIHELDPEYESIEDYPIDEYYNDSSVYELVHEGDWEEIGHRKIDAANSKSDELLSDVENYYKQEYGRYKYNTINVYDGNEDYKGCIQLRIANHTENIHNVDRFGQCTYHISVVIANYDATKQWFGMANAFERRRNERELVFGEDDNFDDVVEEINELIEEFKEEILNE